MCCRTQRLWLLSYNKHSNAGASKMDCQLPIPRDDGMDMMKFINEQVQQHHSCAKTTLNFHMMKALQQQIPSGVIHSEDGEDHHPDRLIWFFRSLYFQRITNTFTNPEVFQMSSTPPLILHEATHQRLRRLLPDHKWALPNFGMCARRVNPTHAQKELATGRPIMSFVGAQGRALWESSTDALYLIIRQACPQALGHGSGIDQLHQIRQHFSRLTDEANQDPSYPEEITRINEDLAGFFTSILDSYQLLLHRYEEGNGRHASTFTVTHAESLSEARAHRGAHKHISHATTTRPKRRTLHIHQFPSFKAILELNYFTVGQLVIRQTRGAPYMGSPLSSTVLDGSSRARAVLSQHVQITAAQLETIIP